MNWRKIAPWNWFRKEQEERALPVAQAMDPFDALRADMDRAFEDAVRRFGSGSPWGWPSLPRMPDWAPPLLRPHLDIAEGRKAYTVRLDVPGVEKGDVTLSVDGDTLRIRGEKKRETEETDEGYHCVERAHGMFERILSLPENADPEAIQAEFKNGVLKITIPKRDTPEAKGRTIEIRHS